MQLGTVALYVGGMLAAALVLNLGGWWLTVRLLDAVRHRLGFEKRVAVRHLRGQRSGFLTAIGVLSILGVSFSSCTLTTVLSVMGGFSNDLKQKILATNAHVIVDQAGRDLEDWRPLLERVRRADGVKAATPLVVGEVMMNARTNNHGVMLKGIELQSFPAVSGALARLERGERRFLEDPQALFELVRKQRQAIYGDDQPGAKPGAEGVEPAPPTPRERVLPAVIVGRELARSLRLYVGAEVNLISPFGDLGPTGPIPKSRPFRAAGEFFSGMYEFDSLFAYITLAEAQKFFRKGDRISEIHVAVADPDGADRVAAGLGAVLGPGYRVRPWGELNASLFSALKLEKIVMFIFLSMAIMVASFCIVATLTMLVLEKGAEISVLLTLGASRRAVQAIFRFEGLLIGLVGTVSGLAVGFGLCSSLTHLGLPIDPEVWYIDRLPVKMSPVEFALVGLASLAITQIATLYPTLVAARRTPVEGLKE